MGLARGESLGLRKCASLPSLSDCGSDRALEVYCGKRQLIELSTKVPTRLHGFLEDIGVAHYFVIVKQTTDGSLTQFDFGPVGGDIAFPQFNSLQLPARGVMGNGDKRNAKRLKQAEIREMKLTELPPQHMYVGRSKLSLKDIRNFNNLQQLTYFLNQNDCRHYVDKLCQYTTGVSHAASLCKRTTFRQRRATPQWSDSVITLAHALTDVANWPKVQTATQMTLTFAGALTSRSTLRRLRPQLLPGLAARVSAVPAPRALVSRTLQRPPIAMATAVAASYTAGRAPAVREALNVGWRIGESVRAAAMNMVASASSVGRSATRAAAGSFQEVLSVAGQGVMGAMAVAGTRSTVCNSATAERPAPSRLRPRLVLPRIGGRSSKVLVA
ncbi:hypothetical protein COCSUDRAFT_65447 [Coccomyxa subellipsoidea C-169]|uniref:PPPDE domain-containing protein n=1 Tax=Coccomyxa subellipsoidea (strain C-169) TaxID=574566 RepID=I0Z1V2_COCSC|nr:hypothetical protein COCSUDRAFT_65447 [Coccomyxa subellipsoidea C-169]EIE24621.1 hypothetical protein COCSUDRAFT_65447 [Coccomyxa subellipsoidea C-169]|eukprot:XP_005649165.1 hypothetical protein COCSUDRAFT_65447 [Coccomyxa subellipsoidea C-169]